MSDIHPNFNSSSMPNDYFRMQQNYTNDKLLYDSLVTEAYNKNGTPMIYYITDYDIDYDKIFGEDLDRNIIRKFECMAYFEFQPELNQFSKFGIEGLDNFSIYASQDHIATASTYGISGATSGEDTFPSHIPKEGDILKSVFNGYWYEIINVNKVEEQFLQTQQHTWNFFVRVLRDKHLSVSETLSGDDIAKTQDINPDIFDISDEVDEEKSEYLYDNSQDTPPDTDPFTGW